MNAFLLLLLALAGFDVNYEAASGTARISAGQRFDELGEAIQAAHDEGWKRIVLPRGINNIGTPPIISSPDVEIIGYRDTVVTNASTGAVGHFDVTSAAHYFRLTGAKIRSTVNANNQVGVRVTGSSFPQISRCLFEATNSDSTTANPPIFVHYIGTADGGVEDNDFLLNTGYIGIKVEDTQANRVGRSRIRNNRFTNGQVTFASRGCHIAVDILNAGFMDVTGNIFQHLNPCTHVVRYDNTHTPAASSEHGHMLFSGNHIENCQSNQATLWQGLKWSVIEGNLIGPTAGTLETHASVVLVPSTSGGSNCEKVKIWNNSIHNPGTDDQDAVGVYLASTQEVTILGNTFDTVQSKHAIWVRENNNNVSILMNDFYGINGAGSPPISPVRINNGLDYDQYSDAGNKMRGFSSATFITGAFGAGSEDIIASPMYLVASGTSIDVSDANTITDSANGLGGFLVGDLVKIRASTSGNDLDNSRVAIVVAVAAGPPTSIDIDTDGDDLTADSTGTLTITRLAPSFNYDLD